MDLRATRIESHELALSHLERRNQVPNTCDMTRRMKPRDQRVDLVKPEQVAHVARQSRIAVATGSLIYLKQTGEGCLSKEASLAKELRVRALQERRTA